ncbi:GvpL/GvpF family gas vesicle protein [Salsuginibacillus kocurii]|uniref:GvpL/GvpF family gas vesicle protein n=1 Tax=Salsuginibacillus kocurii TaxID=427078 RepID=UPI00037DDA89|nr:GvpL/GvpF family gas vesicle protein [Salsuginibacillus kocurii]
MKELVYVYGFVSVESIANEDCSIFDLYEEQPIQFFSGENVAAAFSYVRTEDFAQENFEENVQDMKWLEQKAKRHHSILNQLHETYHVIPLNFGTIYQGTAKLNDVLHENNETFQSQLEAMKDKEEWSLKVYAETQQLKAEATFSTEAIEAKKQEIEKLSKGRQYIERKRLDRTIEAEAERYINQFCQQVHDVAKKFSEAHEEKEQWSKQMTGMNTDMKWNAVYLVHKKNRDDMLAELQTMQSELPTTMTVQLTGPWPGYHFASKVKRGEVYGT